MGGTGNHLVSILVLMEEPLKPPEIENSGIQISRVSILVLMEEPLKQLHNQMDRIGEKCFNPCFNGRTTSTYNSFQHSRVYHRFNPCFNGRTTSTLVDYHIDRMENVGFNPCFNGRTTSTLSSFSLSARLPCFNPCFNGRTTSTQVRFNHPYFTEKFQSLF